MRWLILSVLLPGCVARLQVESRPPGAVVHLPSGATITTPGEIKARWIPWKRRPIEASSPGYRPLRMDLREHDVTMWHSLGLVTHPFRKVDGRIELILIPEHGPAGTWTPESEDLD